MRLTLPRMRFWVAMWLLASMAVPAAAQGQAESPGLTATRLRCEHLADPLGIDAPSPRLSWIVESSGRAQKQTAYRILVASSSERLQDNQGDLWDSGRVASDSTTLIPYAGKPLQSRMQCFWKVMAWDRDGRPSAWSQPARWSMGLLRPADWTAQWISYKDGAPLHADRGKLFLPPARQYRKQFSAAKPVQRATVYLSALGICDLYLNGQRVDDRYFAPGWADYHRRAYYVTYDVTKQIRANDANTIGAVVADGWYSGYVGYGALVGYGPNRAGRYFYGKTPSFIAQLELEYADGTREKVATDATWKGTGQGPVREADMIMGETFDARLDRPGWCRAGFDDSAWANAIPAEANGSIKAVFSDNRGDREVELGFQKPPRMQAYSGPPVRVTQEIKPVSVKEHKPGVYIFDLGQNFAGVIRLKVKGPAGTNVRIRHGEMLHPDGRLMTENLRSARATDYYILRGDANGETWTPRFTYHGFQYVELTGLPGKPEPDAVTGLVIHSDTPLASSFECSDPMANRLFQNVVWTQRANFVELPTDCPQRDERLGWMGDAQIYVRTASYNADVAAFFTKWMDDVEEAQLSYGAYPDYCPYPMSHGTPRKSYGTAWMDAGIICPWTIWQVYGDTGIIARHYDSMTRFMEFRIAVSPDHGGVSIGNPWGDWLNLNEPTPVEYVDHCYYAGSAAMMADMAAAIGRNVDAGKYRQLVADVKAAFNRQYLNPDGTLKVQTQSAHVLALSFNMLPDTLVKPTADRLAAMIEKNGYRMATGFLGTKPLLPVLTANGHHDLAVRMFQSRHFPSWGYEVENGATSIWERWDSFTKEHGFEGLSGKNNAAMNSFSHYSFGAVCEWMFRSLAGIDAADSGFGQIVIRPGPPSLKSNPDRKPIDWVKAEYNSPRGRIASEWKQSAGRFELFISIPTNTTATVFLPREPGARVSESGKPVEQAEGVKLVGERNGRAVLKLGSGAYHLVSSAVAPAGQ